MPEGLVEFLRGGTMMSLLAIGVHFLVYWLVSRDRLFFFFSIAFICLALSQATAITQAETDHGPHTYLIRLVAFILIIAGIIEKNLPKKQVEKDNPSRGSN